MRNSKSEHIIHFYFTRLSKFAEEIKNNFDEKPIHLFRVDVKKLRAFLRMMRESPFQPDRIKLPRKLKKMYSLIGKMRDHQLAIKRLNESKTAEKKEVQDRIHNLQKELELLKKEPGLLTKDDFESIERKVAAKIPIMPGEVLTRNFFLQNLDTIREVINRGIYKDKELHAIRKSMKDIIYITWIFRDDCKIPMPFLFWTDDEIKHCEDLAHRLGLFNDACIALSFLQTADIKKKTKQGQGYLAFVHRQWLAEKLRLKKEIIKELATIRLDPAGAVLQ